LLFIIDTYFLKTSTLTHTPTVTPTLTLNQTLTPTLTPSLTLILSPKPHTTIITRILLSSAYTFLMSFAKWQLRFSILTGQIAAGYLTGCLSNSHQIL